MCNIQAFHELSSLSLAPISKHPLFTFVCFAARPCIWLLHNFIIFAMAWTPVIYKSNNSRCTRPPLFNRHIQEDSSHFKWTNHGMSWRSECMARWKIREGRQELTEVKHTHCTRENGNDAPYSLENVYVNVVPKWIAVFYYCAGTIPSSSPFASAST